MKGGGNSESEERRERRVTIRKIGVWIGGCVTPYLVVPAAEQPRLKQTKKQNSETSILRWASQLGLGATQETFRMSRAWEFFGFINGIFQDPISSFSGLDPKFLYTESKAWGNNSCRSFTKTKAHPPLHSQEYPMMCGKEEEQKEWETHRPRTTSSPSCLHTGHLGSLWAQSYIRLLSPQEKHSCHLLAQVPKVVMFIPPPISDS